MPGNNTWGGGNKGVDSMYGKILSNNVLTKVWKIEEVEWQKQWSANHGYIYHQIKLSKFVHITST